MDDRRFDQLVKAVASGASRRSVLKGMLGLGGAALVGSAVLEPAADAARRPTPTPKPPSCPGQQTPVGGQCICQVPKAPGPYKCGPDCCTGQVTDTYPRPAGHSECCDNACCFGTCYGEELCCPTNSRSGGLPPLAELCSATNECCLAPDFCCTIDGCCSTLCWGGSFDDDFCCPADDLCPGGGSSSDICCTNNTTCCGAGTDENVCVDLSTGGCCVASDCGPVEEGSCEWACSANQCERVSCEDGTICCQGACVSSSEYEACPTDPNECCDLRTDVCCGEACCASGRCNAAQQCCGQSQFVCGQGCCETGPGATCCGGNTCCLEDKCAGGVTCCTGSDIACGEECCPEDRCSVNAQTSACCSVGFLACSGGVCCRADVYQCATDGPGCECLAGTEPCGLLPGGCCPDGQCNYVSGECCVAGTSPCGDTCCSDGQCNRDPFCCPANTTPCGEVCCDDATQTCSAQGVCECTGELISCGGACIDAQCCGTDSSLCANLGFDPECVQCLDGVCVDAGFDFNECDNFSGWCSNGVCNPCFGPEEVCTEDVQCCSNFCNPTFGTCEQS